MNSIYKYPLSIDTNQVLLMPRGAKVLAIQIQHGQPTLWALVDVEVPLEHRNFSIRGTGRTFIADGLDYVGTWQDGAYVWHLFERKAS